MYHKASFGFNTFYTKNVTKDIATDMINIFKEYGYDVTLNHLTVIQEGNILMLTYNGTISGGRSKYVPISTIDTKLYLYIKISIFMDLRENIDGNMLTMLYR
jgi:hypothetical protein